MTANVAFTTEHGNALNAVNLQLFRIGHGITEQGTYSLDRPQTRVQGLTDKHYAGLLHTTDALQPSRDVLAMEPAGFKTDQPAYSLPEDLAPSYSLLQDLVPFTVPEGAWTDLSKFDRLDVLGVLRHGRETFRFNNYVYAAARAWLRGIPVHRAGACRAALEAFADQSPKPSATKERAFRRDAVLASLGDIAVGMVADLGDATARSEDKPTLLFVQSPKYTRPMAKLLKLHGVAASVRTYRPRAGRPLN